MLCGAFLVPAACRPEPTAVGDLSPVPPGMHLLLQPTGSPDSLLGREVKIGDDGGYSIAPERRPGCIVEARDEVSAYDQSFSDLLDRVADVAGGRASVASFSASSSKQIEALFDIHNESKRVASLAGDCGAVVIDEVMIGTGRRSFSKRVERKVSGSVTVSHVPLGGGGGQARNSAAALEWNTPQGWAIHVRDFDGASLPRLDLMLEDQVTDGGQLHLRVSSTVEVDLVVAYFEADGKGDVIWPSASHPDTHVPRGGVHEFPPLDAGLRNPGVPASEYLVVYAFTSREEFDRLKPAPGSWAVRGPTARTLFEGQFEQVPPSRRAKAEIYYRINPASGGP